MILGTSVNAETLNSSESGQNNYFDADTTIESVANDPAFSGNGRFLFPLNRNCYSGQTLKDLRLLWYTKPNLEGTLDILNTLKSRVLTGQSIFIDIYTEEDKKRDPSKNDVKLVFFKGQKGGRTAVLNAGGGFVYVGAMQDSFPHALELSKKGYNAFALIYRPEPELALSDLAHALLYLHEHQSELEIDMTDYSLCGGSAGARMAAVLGNEGSEAFGLAKKPFPAAVIMQYTSYSYVSGREVPTYSNVGTSDWIADCRVMKRRLERIKNNGTDTMFEVFDGLPHGFGIGRDTVAFGWLNRAVTFWEKHMNSKR